MHSALRIVCVVWLVLPGVCRCKFLLPGGRIVVTCVACCNRIIIVLFTFCKFCISCCVVCVAGWASFCLVCGAAERASFCMDFAAGRAILYRSFYIDRAAQRASFCNGFVFRVALLWLGAIGSGPPLRYMQAEASRAGARAVCRG